MTLATPGGCRSCRCPRCSRPGATVPRPLELHVTVAVRDQSVLVVNNDGHLYSLFAGGGNQRWKYACLPRSPSLAPALQDDLIYLASGSTIMALRDLGGSAELAWQALERRRNHALHDLARCAVHRRRDRR